MQQAIDIYETHGIVVGKRDIELATRLMLNYPQKNTFYMDEQLKELIHLIHDQNWSWRFVEEQKKWDAGWDTEQKIKTLLQDFLWDDIEPYVKEEWRQEAVKNLM